MKVPNLKDSPMFKFFIAGSTQADDAEFENITEAKLAAIKKIIREQKLPQFSILRGNQIIHTRFLNKTTLDYYAKKFASEIKL